LQVVKSIPGANGCVAHQPLSAQTEKTRDENEIRAEMRRHFVSFAAWNSSKISGVSAAFELQTKQRHFASLLCNELRAHVLSVSNSKNCENVHLHLRSLLLCNKDLF